MKTIKIGRGQANDIVINDPTVSSEHAKITILDSGNVVIKDLNSKNGTFVNGKRIVQDTPITASDAVTVSKQPVEWLKYVAAKPAAPSKAGWVNPSEIAAQKTIGRSPGNDLVLAYNDVSGSHAQLVKKKNGDVVIVDKGSSNGTYVNGNRISMHTLHAGDTVLIAGKYPFDWNAVFPAAAPGARKNQENGTRFPVWIAACALALVLVAGAGYAYWKYYRAWAPEKIYSTYKKSVVLIRGTFYYEVTVKGNLMARYTLSSDGIVEVSDENPPAAYTGTGFFVSADGLIVTNRHVVVPWMGEEETMETIKTHCQQQLLDLSEQKGSSALQLLASEVKVEGKLASLGIFLNDTRVNNYGEMIPCSLVKESGNDKIDVGLIQVNSKSLPADVKTIVDLQQIDNEIKEGKPVYTIGFPSGFNLALTDQGIEANHQSGEITQVRDDASFGHNITIIGGASGSPVFNNKGRLIGIVNAGYSRSQGYNFAIKARHAADLVK